MRRLRSRDRSIARLYHVAATPAPEPQEPVPQAGARAGRAGTGAGKALRLLSNALDAPARDTADLYKRRRALESFFRRTGRNPKIEPFPGAGESAGRIRGAAAPNACLPLRLAQHARRAVQSPLAFARLGRANLMRRKRIDRLTGAHIPPPEGDRLTAMQWPMA